MSVSQMVSRARPVHQALPVHLEQEDTMEPGDEEGRNKGDQGIMVSPGMSGKQGIMGPIGLKGETGNKGEKGDMGPASMSGTKGEPGESMLLFLL